MSRTTAAIVGGGFSGLVTAAALARLGFEVKVFEATPNGDGRFRGELIHPRGVRGLDSLGLLAPLKAIGGVDVVGFAATPFTGDVTTLQYGRDRGPGLGVEHHAMVQALRAEVGGRRGVSLHSGARVDDVLRDGARVTGVKLSDGATHSADLVVVADGRSSKVREKLGLEPTVTVLSHTIALGVSADLPFGMRGHVFLGAPGPILAYPYAPGRVRFCIDLPLGLAKGKAAIVEVLEKDYARAVPTAALREAMLRSLKEEGFEGAANQSVRTKACAAPGVVLLGDAGGASHPLTASGMTNAVHDVLTLAEEVQRNGVGDRALSRYQRRRFAFVRMRELFTDSLYEIFRAHDEGSRALQEGVFAYWNASERSRRESMDILSGENVHVSRFALEYLEVMRRSAQRMAVPTLRAPVKSAPKLRALALTGFARLSEAVERSAHQVADRYRLELAELP